ncbi:MAG TPA: FAD binding domain-containing protein [Paenalcaligenes sp.]|nr:FAD binding domain-containing protein [Paenalcaligenes sp.]
MKPRAFKFHSPQDIPTALTLAEDSDYDFMYFAGGTEALIGLKERVLTVEHLINIKGIPGLKEIRVENQMLSIGALVTHQEIADSPIVQEVLPAYATLSNNIANVRVRQAGTLAGNLCFAEPNADPPAFLAAMDAQLVLVGPEGERQVPVRRFFDGPYSTVREDEELLTQILIPVAAQPQKSIYKKVVYLHRPTVGVAAVCTTLDGQQRWEVWAGALTGEPERMDQLCELLAQGTADKAALQAAAKQDVADWDVLEGVFGSPDYRKHLATVLAIRCVMELADD